MRSLSALCKSKIKYFVSKFFLLALGIILSKCSTTTIDLSNHNWQGQRVLLEKTSDWQLRGRVNVRYQNESYTPRIQWQQQGDNYRIRLWGTFNAGNTVIIGEPKLVTMEHDGDSITAHTPEELVLDNLGYELPISYLEFWVRSLPAPGSDAKLEFSVQKHLSTIKQDGWEIAYLDMRQFDGVILPRRVEITGPRDDMRLRFVGLSWTLNTDEN